MLIEINKNIRIWYEHGPLEQSSPVRLGFSKSRVEINGHWYDVITPSELIRKRSAHDGYYRVIYVQINMETGEYYIGKSNRPKWSELVRYQGSGLKFTNKFKKSSAQFVRYFIAVCQTAEETERIEASIVDSNILADEKCLNLVRGGGGTTKHPSVAETSQKKREYMRCHPDQFKPMIDASKKAFRSGDTPSLRARSQRIKEVMNTDKYREMSRTRILKWKNENPEEYAEARKRNREAIRTDDCQTKRKNSLNRWALENPVEHRLWQQKLLESRTSKEAKEKRTASLREWRANNPDQAKANSQKRAKAAAAKLSKQVCMIDLQSGKILETFSSQHAAAGWLVKNGKAKNMNCVSSISSVCLRKPCSTGYGYRKKAYGYDWRFASEMAALNK